MARQRRTVRLLLLEDREHLGVVGDVVDVKPGFARNYLVPRGAATPVTSEALHRVAQVQKRAVAMRREREAQLQAVAEQLEGLSLTFEEKASDEGHLFGSVSASEIRAALEARGITIEERHVGLERPLKELGIYNVPIHVDAGRTADVRVWVVEPSS